MATPPNDVAASLSGASLVTCIAALMLPFLSDAVNVQIVVIVMLAISVGLGVRATRVAIRWAKIVPGLLLLLPLCVIVWLALTYWSMIVG